MLRFSLIFAALNQLVILLHVYLLGFDVTGKTQLTAPGYAQFYQNTLFPIQIGLELVLILLILISLCVSRWRRSSWWQWAVFLITFGLLLARGF